MTENIKYYNQFVNIILILFIAICACGSILLQSCAFLCMAIGIIFIMIIQNEHLMTKILSFCTLAIIIYMTYLKIISFDFMAQAYVLLETNTSLFFWLQQGHIHAIRLAIVYPSYLMHVFFDIELNLVFGYYCSIIFSLIYIFISKIVDYFVQIKKLHIELMIVLFTIMLACVMNGRICFAFLGFAILIHEMISLYREEKTMNWILRYIKVIAGLILSTVSSGTMIVCLSFVLIMFAFRVLRQKRIQVDSIRLWIICILGAPVLYVGAKYVKSMINKNITYFGGGIEGIINMLQHGIGRLFGNISGVYSLMIIAVGIMILIINIGIIVYIYKHHLEYIPLVIGANIAFYGLFVGISTGTLILIPGMILVAIFLDKFEIIEEGENGGKKHFKFS